MKIPGESARAASADAAKLRPDPDGEPNSKVTHCPRGHLHAFWNNDPAAAALGRRNCLACRRAQHARSNAKKRGEIWEDWEFIAQADWNYFLLTEQAELV